MPAPNLVCLCSMVFCFFRYFFKDIANGCQCELHSEMDRVLAKEGNIDDYFDFQHLNVCLVFTACAYFYSNFIYKFYLCSYVLLAKYLLIRSSRND